MASAVRTTGQLHHRFQVLRKAAEGWLRDLPRGGRPRLHIFPHRFLPGGRAPAGPFAIFPGSFDPPSAAHIRIARGALRRGPFRSLILDLDLANVDKAGHALPLADRIALLCVAFRKETAVAIGVSTHGRFLEKVEAAGRSGLARGGVRFIVGADTIDRILQPRYYRHPDREIPRLLEAARFLVFPRLGSDRSPGDRGRFRPRITMLPLGRRLQALSSTRLRRSLGAGRLPRGETPDEVLFCIRESGLYRRTGRPETHVVTAFLERGGRVLLLKRSAEVGTFRGAWAGVSGFIEWPLHRTGELLEGRIRGREVTRQALRQALTEIREETGIGRRSLTLLRRSRPLTFTDLRGGRDWVVHPFLFRVEGRARIRLDFEHDEGRWVWPERIDEMGTVPGLGRTLSAVLAPPRKKRPAAAFHDRAVAIASDPKGGAMEILAEALRLLREVAELGPVGEEAILREARELRIGLLSGHPMAPLQNLADRIGEECARGGAGLDRRLLRLVDSTERAVREGDDAILRKAMRALRGKRRLATYSYSSTVAAVLARVGRRRGVEVTVVGDGGGHGRRLRRRLLSEGVRCRPIASRLPEETEAVLLGADAVHGDGSFLNARGTGRVVERARGLGIPVWVLAHPVKRRPGRGRPPRGGPLARVKGAGVRFL